MKSSVRKKLTNVFIEFHHFMRKRVDTPEDFLNNSSKAFLNQWESKGFYRP